MDEGDLATLHVCNRTPIEMVRRLGERRTLAEFLGSSAGMAFLGELPQARANVEASVPLWREIGDQAGLGRTLGNLATLTKLEGDYARARALCAESRQQFESTGDHQGVEAVSDIIPPATRYPRSEGSAALARLRSGRRAASARCPASATRPC